MRRPKIKSWRYHALVAEFNLARERLFAHNAAGASLRREYTGILERLAIARAELAAKGRVTSLRPAAKVEAIIPPEETRERLKQRIEERRGK